MLLVVHGEDYDQIWKCSMLQGLLTRREDDSEHQEDPRKKGTSFCWVYMQKLLSVLLPTREGIKDGGQQ